MTKELQTLVQRSLRTIKKNSSMMSASNALFPKWRILPITTIWWFNHILYIQWQTKKRRKFFSAKTIHRTDFKQQKIIKFSCKTISQLHEFQPHMQSVFICYYFLWNCNQLTVTHDLKYGTKVHGKNLHSVSPEKVFNFRHLKGSYCPFESLHEPLCHCHKRLRINLSCQYMEKEIFFLIQQITSVSK